ncbi:MAG: chemotaxis protein CheW [Brasilonema octagenarum HA4186-MV1]|jgi:twitching motility protein PilI|uniref:Chemotaxis protein CheW n=2 Tax=Brasilonema TaxID=383614 RepID=A0A856M9B4_9CYAN|nr:MULTISPECIES: chemotaxis protein CheW [Brasilonema]MBW4626764.1 chemotaxis protein CheW [Brasilonema octagenarum HA4186-MV1]NMF64224.1 chemotaxis protein CheW [Brasilonema octagenarum UFV-OR1]QDL07765.1 chemotaxis protein CheW [Brasilonema sennae CENA114]QDL14127.1 chemotaxis protein CheW [Brasilonema octagenarum UFV-E1]
MITQADFLGGSGQEQSRSELEVKSPEKELCLRFYIPFGSAQGEPLRQEFALLASDIREVIELSPDRITPIPNTSSLVLGALNLRGRVIWVADLGQFLGQGTTLNTNRSQIPVIAIEQQDIIVGLAVEEIGGMDWLDKKQLRVSMRSVPDTMALFLQGEWILGAKKNQCLRLLDHKAILRSALWVG